MVFTHGQPELASVRLEISSPQHYRCQVNQITNVPRFENKILWNDSLNVSTQNAIWMSWPLFHHTYYIIGYQSVLTWLIHSFVRHGWSFVWNVESLGFRFDCISPAHSAAWLCVGLTSLRCSARPRRQVSSPPHTVVCGPKNRVERLQPSQHYITSFFFYTWKLASDSVSTAAPGMAEVPGTSSETITETVQTSTPPPPQQVRNNELVLFDVLPKRGHCPVTKSGPARRRPRCLHTGLMLSCWSNIT